MKKVLLSIGLITVISSCNHVNTHGYILRSITVVADSLKDRQATFVTETVRAASQHMTGGDYEDPEDVIEAANNTFEHIYGVHVECLYNNGVYILPQDFDSTQMVIFNYLKSN